MFEEKAGELAVHFLAGSLSADAFAWCGQGSGHRRSGGGHVLLVQFPDHSGRAQHQDAGDSVPALGACGGDIHLPIGSTSVARFGPSTGSGTGQTGR